MAGLWSCRVLPGIRSVARRLTQGPARRLAQRLVFGAMLIAMPGCSQIALQDSTEPTGPQPPYVSLAAKYLQSNLKDLHAYDGFEISPLRWVSTIKGWSWLACVRFHDHGHTRIYAIFFQDNAVSDARYAVETDTCEAQSYTQFDLISGVLGQPTAPVQEPIY
jgi:hypothetical protein